MAKLIIYPPILIILALSFSNCSFIRIKSRHKGIDPNLEVYRKTLFKITKGKLGKENIGLGFFLDKDPLVTGSCNFVLSEIKQEIDINPIKWKRYTLKEKLLLLAHEYGHCQCFMDHNNDKFKDGCPKSFMNPFKVPKICIKRYDSVYFKQILKGCEG